MDLAHKHVLVLGLGESGLAMARWCARRGARARVADTRAEPPSKAALLAAVKDAELRSGEFESGLLDGIDLVCLSPGLAANTPVVVEARARGIAVTGEIELFAQGLRRMGWRDTARIIAITGTNGKTTTTALTGHLCRSAGLDTAVAGNISPAALDALMAREDEGRRPEVWVLELSSYQLETLETLAADAATVLNISEDHLDRYADIEDYAAAKARIFIGCGTQVINRDDARVSRMQLPHADCISFGLSAPPGHEFGLRQRGVETWLARGDEDLLPLPELAMPGLHNAANAMAALALCSAIGLEAMMLLPALREFKGLPHRVERVAEIEGVVWYDDSKGTNVGATVAALEGLQRKVVLILGGDGKGQDFTPLGPAVDEYARAVILIGRDAPLIHAVLRRCGPPLLKAESLEQAVQLAAQEAEPGDAVLLSPACASFDMFRNYEHRAQVFVDAVRRLAAGGRSSRRMAKQ